MAKKEKITDEETGITVISRQNDEIRLFSNVAQIIEKRKFNIISAANNQIVLMFWEIGKYINSVVLGMERAEYGKRIVATLSQQSFSHIPRVPFPKLRS